MDGIHVTLPPDREFVRDGDQGRVRRGHGRNRRRMPRTIC